MSETAKPSCCWILMGFEPFECSAPATQRDKESGETFCEYHAVDYAETFGQEALETIPKPPSQRDET